MKQKSPITNWPGVLHGLYTSILSSGWLQNQPKFIQMPAHVRGFNTEQLCLHSSVQPPTTDAPAFGAAPNSRSFMAPKHDFQTKSCIAMA